MKAARYILFLTLLPLPSAAQEPAEPDYPALPEYRVFATPASPEDERAITELMDRFSRAWGAQDIDALLTTYTEDAEWTNAFGWVSRGHDELRETFEWVFDRFPATGDEDASADAEPLSDEERGRLSRRYIGDDAAVIFSVTESDWGESRDGSGLRRVYINYVLAKHEGEWPTTPQLIMDARR